MRNVHTLIKLCRSLGQDPLLVQAGGGNISVKTKDGRCFVKASGCRLSEVSAATGWVKSDLGRMVKSLCTVDGSPRMKTEKKYADFIRNASQTPDRTISMEAGFHAVIPDTFVIHVHSVAGIILGLLSEQKMKKVLSTVIDPQVCVHVIDSSKPGLELTNKIINEIRGDQSNRFRYNSTVHLWVLRNHGLIWSGDDLSAVMRCFRSFESKLRKKWHLKRYPMPHERGTRLCRSGGKTQEQKQKGKLCFCRWPKTNFDFSPLFPDFGVYFNLWTRAARPDLIKTSPNSAKFTFTTKRNYEDKQGVLFAHALVSTVIKGQGHFHKLPTSVIHSIRSMEMERLRMAQSSAK